MLAFRPLPAEGVRRGFAAHVASTVADLPPEARRSAAAWRESRYAHGERIVAWLAERGRSVAGRTVVDVACAWGGEIVAAAAAGARAFGFDLHDHAFAALNVTCRALGLTCRVAVAPCEAIPMPDRSVDVLFAFELVEHLPDVDAFAREVARVLAPGGVALLTTPPRLRAIVEGEPHWGLRGIAILPQPAQRWIATRLCGRSYPYPITAQYLTAAQVLRPFRRLGLRGRAHSRGRLGRYLRRWPPLARLYRAIAWDLLVVEAPGEPRR